MPLATVNSSRLNWLRTSAIRCALIASLAASLGLPLDAASRPSIDNAPGELSQYLLEERQDDDDDADQNHVAPSERVHILFAERNEPIRSRMDFRTQPTAAVFSKCPADVVSASHHPDGCASPSMQVPTPSRHLLFGCWLN